MSKSTPSSRSLHRSIHWFRKGLRLHDNPALLAACKDGEQVRPVFILDPWFAKNARVGINRWRFLLQSLQDLDNALRSLNGRLYVVRGKPCEVLPTLFRDWRISRLTYEVDTEPYARERDEEVEKVAEEHGVKVVTAVSHTLYDTERVAARNGGKPPLTYQACQKILSQLGPPPKPCPTLSLDTLDGVMLPVDDDHNSRYGVPTLEDLGKSSTDCGECLYPGGESHALKRMELCIKKTEWICKFEKPKTEPNTLAPSTTVLSPYLKFGCLSPRLFYVKLKEVYAKSKHSQPPVSLEGQLLWREFFYVVGANTPNFDRMQGNRICRQIPWQHNQEWLDAWTQGRTGYPFIDAIMTQLRQEGWIHHLARHAVACFLTRGDLWISWEEGMKVFDELLLDADWSLNAGNWMWLSASAFFHQYFRVYSPVAFGKKTDKRGDYIRKYLPQLKKFPAQYIYEPWTASLGVQKAAGCIIGEDYPRPIVDHDKARQLNIKRMAEAYGASKQENNSVAANQGKRKNDQASNSKKKTKLK